MQSVIFETEYVVIVCLESIHSPVTFVNEQKAIISIIKVGFEVLTAVGMKMAIFWVVAPCSLVEVYQRSRGPCY
jgi:hypothetical protein